jgi:glutaminyl-peptide cyclotransferase
LLYVSEGTEKVHIVDPTTLKVTSSFTVKNGKDQPIRGINEMQWIDGQIWANVFQTDHIVLIDPKDGYITKAIDLKALHDAEMDLVKQQYSEQNKSMNYYDYGNNVLNGIAHDPQEDIWYVTGKRWNLLFKIKIN